MTADDGGPALLVVSDAAAWRAWLDAHESDSDGVRLVLNLSPGEGLAGLLTRDWVKPTVGAPKTS